MLNKELFLVEDLNKAEKVATRDGYGKALLMLGEQNKNVVGLCADLTESVRMHWFAEKYPERYVAMGVAEQNMMGVAVGLSFAGKIPFASSFSVFSPGRNWDQFRVSVCYSRANVKVCSSHAGLTVGEDGATHQALEDIAIARVLPNLTVIVPSDALETQKVTVAIAALHGPVYMRFSREKTAVYTTEKTPFEIGKALVVREGKDATVIACGIMVVEALKAAEILQREGISIEVINNHTIKPMDTATIVASVQKTKRVVTAEEHQKTAGLRGAVLELLAEHAVSFVAGYVAVEDTFGESGTSATLLEKYGLTAQHIAEEVKKLVKRKQ